MIYIVFCLFAIVIAFSSRFWAWSVLLLPFAHLLFTALAIRLSPEKPKYFPELSEHANLMLQKWHQYYLRPFAGADFSSGSSGVGFTAVAVAIIGCFYQFYIGVVFGVMIYLLTFYMARLFNPTNCLTDTMLREAHKEVIEFINRRRQVAMDTLAREQRSPPRNERYLL
jgi:hypothetical protein